MAITSGQLLAHYRIGNKIGAGGMGEVWEAVDTSLDRAVAIKVLPDAVARDTERLARFEREARLLASLNHPGIAAVYGLHEAHGTRFLAMELVPGEDLAERLKRGPLPTEAALRIALQVAEALEAAHEHGVIHRDLKPANVRIMPDGRVKVLDFGLAKAFDATAPARSSDLSHSPTLTSAHTVDGVILGTAGYMSPEQAAGQPTDKRADIWSFGVLLHEMLTGARLFHGETVSHTLADVLRASIDWDKLPASVPSSVRRLLKRCLDRDLKRRLRDIGEARVRIEDILSGVADADSKAAAASASVPARGRAWGWIVAALAILAAGISIALQLGGTAPAPRQVRRFSLKIPTNTSATRTDGRAIAVSPDGRLVVSRGSMGNDDLLYLRDVDSFDTRPLSGTNGALEPVFSPDGRWLAYRTSRGLHKISLAGGAPTPLGALPASSLGLTWSRDGFLYYGAHGQIWRIPEKGGEGEIVTKKEETAKVSAFRNPHALPSGKALLLDQAGDRLLALDPASGRIKDLGLEGSCPLYVPTGHLLFVRGDQVQAVGFDADGLEPIGNPIPILDRVSVENDIMQLDLSAEGTLVYLPRRPGERHQLVLVDRTGLVAPLLGAELPSSVIRDPRFSPDGKRVAVQSEAKLWLIDLASQTPTLIAESGFYPVWGADGGRSSTPALAAGHSISTGGASI